MSDRLSELLRQRALLQEHVAWLDRQIAEASAASRGGPPPSRPAPPAAGAAGTPPASDPAAAAVLTATLNRVPPAVPSPAATSTAATEDEYRVEVKNIERDVRKGCVLYFVAALLFLGVAVAALYYAISSR